MTSRRPYRKPYKMPYRLSYRVMCRTFYMIPYIPHMGGKVVMEVVGALEELSGFDGFNISTYA